MSDKVLRSLCVSVKRVVSCARASVGRATASTLGRALLDRNGHSSLWPFVVPSPKRDFLVLDVCAAKLAMNGADGKAGPRVPKPLDSEAPRPRPAKASAPEKRPAPPAHVDFLGSDAALHKQLAALQAHMAELRTVCVVMLGFETSAKPAERELCLRPRPSRRSVTSFSTARKSTGSKTSSLPSKLVRLKLTL